MTRSTQDIDHVWRVGWHHQPPHNLDGLRLITTPAHSPKKQKDGLHQRDVEKGRVRRKGFKVPHATCAPTLTSAQKGGEIMGRSLIQQSSETCERRRIEALLIFHILSLAAKYRARSEADLRHVITPDLGSPLRHWTQTVPWAMGKIRYVK